MNILENLPNAVQSPAPRKHTHPQKVSSRPPNIQRKPPLRAPHEHTQKFTERRTVTSPNEPLTAHNIPYPITNTNLPPGMVRRAPPPKLTIFIETKKGRVSLYISEGDDVGEVTQRFCQQYDMVEFFDAIYLNVMKKLRNVEKAQQAHNPSQYMR